MTDRDLLEKAKRAYFKFYEDNLRDPDMRRAMERWNPLENDGDALRLAAALHIDLDYYEGYGEVWAHPYDSDTPGVTVVEFTDDRAADTRRAIVKAAASMEAS